MKGKITPVRLGTSDLNSEREILGISHEKKSGPIIKRIVTAAKQPASKEPLVIKPDNAEWSFARIPSEIECIGCHQKSDSDSLVKDDRFARCPFCQRIVFITRTFILNGTLSDI